jgi:Histidine kinase
VARRAHATPGGHARGVADWPTADANRRPARSGFRPARVGPAGRPLPAHHHPVGRAAAGGVLPSPDLRVGRQSRTVRPARALHGRWRTGRAAAQLALGRRACPPRRRGRRHEELLLQREIAASERERRRLATDLHNGVIHDLAGMSMALTASQHSATARGDTDAAAQLQAVAASSRRTTRMRWHVLVDIDPPNLERAGLRNALGDLLETVPHARCRGRRIAGRRARCVAAGNRGGGLPGRPRGGPQRRRTPVRAASTCASSAARRATRRRLPAQRPRARGSNSRGARGRGWRRAAGSPRRPRAAGRAERPPGSGAVQARAPDPRSGGRRPCQQGDRGEAGTSHKTVRNTLSAACRKIGVTDRTQAAPWARRSGRV